MSPIISTGLISLVLVFISAQLPAHSGLVEAEKNFRKEFRVSPEVRFDESPYNGLYMAKDPMGGVKLFSENMVYVGFGNEWELKEASGKIVKLSGVVAAEVMKTELRKTLKTDWMVKSGSQGNGDTRIVISAPNCPYCQIQDKDFQKFSQQLDTQIVVIPTLLGGNSQQFINAVLCSADPKRIWAEAMRGNIVPKTAVSCRHADWASIVLTHTFKPAAGGQMEIRTPAIIRPNGSVVYGWEANQSLSTIKLKLGIE